MFFLLFFYSSLEQFIFWIQNTTKISDLLYSLVHLFTVYVAGVRFLEVKQFVAKIGYQNTKSLALFKKLGFTEVCHMVLIFLCTEVSDYIRCAFL